MSTKVRLRLLMAGAAYFDTPMTSAPVRLEPHGAWNALGAGVTI